MTGKNEPFETRAQGKLLLTGEYFVLDGALALATPVRFGQTLRAEPSKTPARLSWAGKNADGAAWFLAEFELPELDILTATDKKTAETLTSILKACRRQNPGFLVTDTGVKVLTSTDFPREWGLGTSSTLIAALARWAAVDPYTVLFDTLGGSGYDIACAYAEGPVTYRLEGQTPVVQAVTFCPAFAENLFFVYSGKKQDSREGIRRYRALAREHAALADEISELTLRFLAAAALADLESTIREHESLIGRALDLPRAKDLHFNDFWGEIKSLGAWGGDFVLATSDRPEAETRAYFSRRGFDTFLSWRDMVAGGN